MPDPETRPNALPHAPRTALPEEAARQVLPRLLDRQLPMPVGWFLFLLLLLLQWSLFLHYVQREILWGHPMSFDQITYLARSYGTFDQMLMQGPLQGFVYGLRMPVAQGVMIHPQAALLFLVIGASRLSALTLNFLYFALFQFLLLLLA